MTVPALRSGNAITCQSCGRPIRPQRGSRRQRFCSDACRKSAARALKFAARYPYSGASGSVENNAVGSTACNGHFGGRSAVATAFPIDIVGGRFRWPRGADDERAALIRRVVAVEIGGAA